MMTSLKFCWREIKSIEPGTRAYPGGITHNVIAEGGIRHIIPIL
jgi:hypothetical protein